eukprot:468010_1
MNFVKLLSSKISNIKQFKLLFRTSENKYLASKFHSLCDGTESTICIVKSNFGNIFGGYTSIKWESTELWCNSYEQDEKAFLFLIRSDNKLQQKQCPIIYDCIDTENAVCHYGAGGPSFGLGNDLYISAKCNEHPTKDPATDNYNYVYELSYEYPENHIPICGGNFKENARAFTN